jgi:hypothetical protein
MDLYGSHNFYDTYLDKNQPDYPARQTRELLWAKTLPARRQTSPFGDQIERDRYTQTVVERLLRTAQGYTTEKVFDTRPSVEGMRNAAGFVVSSWGITGDFIRNKDRIRLDDAPGRKAYTGTYYLQGIHPTCAAWAVIHGLKVGNIDVPVPFATELLNEAMPTPENPEGGTFHVRPGEIVAEHFGSAVGYDVTEGKERPARDYALMLKEAVDIGGAMLVSVLSHQGMESPIYHRLCLSGYEITGSGQVNAQTIDSACGTDSVAIDSIARAVNMYTADRAIVTIHAA